MADCVGKGHVFKPVKKGWGHDVLYTKVLKVEPFQKKRTCGCPCKGCKGCKREGPKMFKVTSSKSEYTTLLCSRCGAVEERVIFEKEGTTTVESHSDPRA